MIHFAIINQTRQQKKPFLTHTTLDPRKHTPKKEGKKKRNFGCEPPLKKKSNFKKKKATSSNKKDCESKANMSTWRVNPKS